jgi:hypothetical protein
MISEVSVVFVSRFMPCPSCGASIERSQSDAHTCDPERRAAYAMLSLRDEVSTFESQFHTFLTEPQGRFETWVAARHVRRAG